MIERKGLYLAGLQIGKFLMSEPGQLQHRGSGIIPPCRKSVLVCLREESFALTYFTLVWHVNLKAALRLYNSHMCRCVTLGWTIRGL